MLRSSYATYNTSNPEYLRNLDPLKEWILKADVHTFE